jgi:hypothetical protein
MNNFCQKRHTLQEMQATYAFVRKQLYQKLQQRGEAGFMNDFESDFNSIPVHPFNPRLVCLYIPCFITVHLGIKKTQRSGTTQNC